MNPLVGSEELDIHVETIRDYCTLATLADQDTPKEGMALMRAIVLTKIAHDHDIADKDIIEVEFWDIMKGGMLHWQTEMWWRVWCDLCHNTALDNDDMDGYLCEHHTDEAYKQEQADLENDDIAAGVHD